MTFFIFWYIFPINFFHAFSGCEYASISICFYTLKQTVMEKICWVILWMAHFLLGGNKDAEMWVQNNNIFPNRVRRVYYLSLAFFWSSFIVILSWDTVMFLQYVSTNLIIIYFTPGILQRARCPYTVKNAVELLGAFRPDVEKIQYHWWNLFVVLPCVFSSTLLTSKKVRH